MTGSQQPDDGASIEPRRGRRKLVLGISCLAIVLVAGSVVAALSGLGPFGAARTVKPHKAQSIVATQPTYVETPEMLTNLDAGPHRIAFAKLQCRIQVDRSTDAALVSAAMPRIVDMAETYLRAVKPEELRSDTGAYLLREAMMNRLAVAVPGAAISDVLFEELLVQ